MKNITETCPERLIRLPLVEDISGLKKTALYERIREGTFPAPIHLGSPDARRGTSRWLLSSVNAWVQSQAAQQLRISVTAK